MDELSVWSPVGIFSGALSEWEQRGFRNNMDHWRVTSCVCVTRGSPPPCLFRRLDAGSLDYHFQWWKWTSQDWDSLFYPIVNKINIRLDITSDTFLKLPMPTQRTGSAYHVCVIWSLESHWREGEDGDDTDWIWLRTTGHGCNLSNTRDKQTPCHPLFLL